MEPVLGPRKLKVFKERKVDATHDGIKHGVTPFTNTNDHARGKGICVHHHSASTSNISNTCALEVKCFTALGFNNMGGKSD